VLCLGRWLTGVSGTCLVAAGCLTACRKESLPQPPAPVKAAPCGESREPHHNGRWPRRNRVRPGRVRMPVAMLQRPGERLGQFLRPSHRFPLARACQPPSRAWAGASILLHPSCTGSTRALRAAASGQTSTAQGLRGG